MRISHGVAAYAPSVMSTPSRDRPSTVSTTGTVVPPTKGDAATQAVPTVTISPAACGINAAIANAVEALNQVPPGQLRDLVTRTQEDSRFSDWHSDAAQLAEVPDGADDARKDIAQRATRFIQKQISPPRPPGLARENPFYGLSRTELAAIEYDQTGHFTVNERRAASSEAGRQEGDWSEQATVRGVEERARTGKWPKFLREILAHYEALPPVEQVKLPSGYMMKLRLEVAASKRSKAFEFTNHLTLFDVMRRYDARQHPVKGNGLCWPNRLRPA